MPTPQFAPRPDDIYVVTYPRSGTTWLQMILYQLTTDGDMNFTHISERAPYFERGITWRTDINDLPSPRIFKTHLHLTKIKSHPGRYIYLYRDGKDVVVSYYHFYRNYLDYQKTFDEFFESFVRGTVQYGSWFNHVKDAMKHVKSPDTAFLYYEDFVNDLDRRVAEVAEFCGIELLPDKLKRVVERCTFDFMRVHEAKFDHSTELLWEQASKIGRGEFIRKGKIGEWKSQLTKEQELVFDTKEIFSIS